MKSEFFIASRIQLKPESGKISTGVVIAVAGIALALTVMLLSIAVVTGFKEQIREKVMGFDSQITICPVYTDNNPEAVIDVTPQLLDIIASKLPDRARAYPVITRSAILKTDSDFMGLMVKGISPDNPADLINSSIVAGEMPDFAADSTRYHVAISSRTASRLGLIPGDKINAFFINDNGPRARRLKIAAVFDTHFSDYDQAIMFASLEMLRHTSAFSPTDASAIEISGLSTDDEITAIRNALSSAIIMAHYSGKLSQPLTVTDIHSTAALYFNWLALLDTNVIVILIIMTLVASLTLISSLFIIVLERVNMIGILKAMGATDRMIRRVFIIVAERLVIAGLVIGNVASLCIIALQQWFHLIPLDPEAYYLDSVPVALSWWWVLAVNAGVIMVSLIVLIIPSRIVATIMPADSIKFE